MTPTQQTRDEADRVDLVYQYVLAVIGAKAAAELLALWQTIPVGEASRTRWWSRRAAALVLRRREQARALALAYYRLIRALRTGSTIADPFNDTPDVFSLERLRQDFEVIVAQETGDGSTRVTASVEPSGDDDSVTVDAVTGLRESLADDSEQTVSYLNELLADMADAASAKVELIDPAMANADARAEAAALHLQDGAMVAAAGSRVAQNGGRNATNQASARDKAVIGWARQSTTGTPCSFCAMLISRQILYKTAFTAGKGERVDGRVFLGDGMFKFHDNCKCVAVPVMSDAGWRTDPKYAQNRYYNDLWMNNISGKYGGDLAMNEWRKLLRSIRTEQDTKKAAQEAA